MIFMPSIVRMSRAFSAASPVNTTMNAARTRIVAANDHALPASGKMVLTLAAKLALRIWPAVRLPRRQDRDELDQVHKHEPWSLAARGHDWIIRNQAGPSCGQRREVTFSRSVEHAIVAPLHAPLQHLDLSTTVRMERVRDLDRSRHGLGAGCSPYGG